MTSAKKRKELEEEMVTFLLISLIPIFITGLYIIAFVSPTAGLITMIGLLVVLGIVTAAKSSTLSYFK